MDGIRDGAILWCFGRLGFFTRARRVHILSIQCLVVLMPHFGNFHLSGLKVDEVGCLHYIPFRSMIWNTFEVESTYLNCCKYI
jgi:hypothetical protein